jgi:hypothetical protein
LFSPLQEMLSPLWFMIGSRAGPLLAAGNEAQLGPDSGDDSDDARAALPEAYRGPHTTHAPAPEKRAPGAGGGEPPATRWGHVPHGPAVQPDGGGPGRAGLSDDEEAGGGGGGDGRGCAIGAGARLRLDRVYGVQGTGLGSGGGTAQVHFGEIGSGRDVTERCEGRD